MKIGCVRGVPGSGKTRYIINLIRQAAKKYGPERVGAISYTNAAVEEIKERAIADAGFSAQSAINIRTLHSHCWRLLNMNSDRHAESHIKFFCESYPQFAISQTVTDDSLSVNTRQNDMLFSRQSVLRSMEVPLDQWPVDVRFFYQAWRDWMTENNMIDYTGMIETVLKLNKCPEIDVLFIDEAQDMSKIQLRATLLWAEGTVSTIWCGDSDQSIFRFAGADASVFDNLCKKSEWFKYLDQSHRLPVQVHHFVTGKVLSQISGREPLDFKPKNSEGAFSESFEPDLSLPGTHMILCRCNYQVGRWIDFLIEKKTLWHNPYREKDLYWNPAKTKAFRAVNTYAKVMAGESISLSEIKTMMDSTISKGNLRRGAKKELEEVEHIEFKEDIFGLGLYGFLPEFTSDDKPITEKFRLTGKASDLLFQSEDIASQAPRVVVGTIHSVKGGEADHVWIDCDMPSVVRKSIYLSESSRNDELRVLYVGATRAKESLHLINRSKGMV